MTTRKRVPPVKSATASKKSIAKRKAPSSAMFGAALANEQLTGLAAELQTLRSHPPLTRRKDGKYEGDILGFVKGLRLAARLVHFLRERLSGSGLEVNWGHLINKGQSCSPECDVIIHGGGHVREWNGHTSPIMNFKFVDAEGARAVVSCKSFLNAIDRSYPKALKKFGVTKVFLFAECCRRSRLDSLRKTAKSAGYSGVWCLYFTDDDAPSYATQGPEYVDFGSVVAAAVVNIQQKRSVLTRIGRR